VKPSEYPEVQAFPHLRDLLERQVDMQFDDVRTLLQLPHPPDLGAGCNLSLANILFTLIGGASVMFFRADISYFERYKGSGKRFKALMREHYPWQPDDSLSPGEASGLIYTFARNPLTHSFGIGKSAHLFPGAPSVANQPIWLAKGAFSPSQADLILSGQRPRPVGLPPTLEDHLGGVVLSVPSLAWGTAAMCRSLFADKGQSAAAEKLAGEFLGETS
jgi:hypothetical protein